MDSSNNCVTPVKKRKLMQTAVSGASVYPEMKAQLTQFKLQVNSRPKRKAYKPKRHPTSSNPKKPEAPPAVPVLEPVSERQPLSVPPVKNRKLIQSKVSGTSIYYPEMRAQVTQFTLQEGSPKRKGYKSRRLTESASLDNHNILASAHVPVMEPDSGSFMELIKRVETAFPTLNTKTFSDAKVWWAVIGREPTSTFSPLTGKSPIVTPRVIVQETQGDQSSLSYRFEVNFVTMYAGVPSDTNFMMYLRSMLPGSNYHICSGLSENATLHPEWDSPSVRRWGFPFNRVDHRGCQMWIAGGTCTRNQSSMCSCCKSLTSNILLRDKKRLSASPSTKAKRLDPSSNYPIKYLTPACRKKRESLKRKQKMRTSQQLERLRSQMSGYDINVNEATNSEYVKFK